MKRLAVLGMVALFLAAAVAQASKNAGKIDYKEYKLDNGLRVILSEDHSVPVVAVDIWYHVGSAYEEEGHSGFAHLFEHMMFQGSENVAKAEHFQLVARAGGNVNGSTTEDRTNYWEVLPASQLNLGVWLEADRMRSLAITEENFENQRETVKEERRQRVDNQPYGAAFLTADTLSYDFKPYSHTVIGRMADLDAAKAEDAQAFFHHFYNPNNAVLTIVGDIEPKKALKVVEGYFGKIPRGPDVTEISGTEPPHKAERRMVMEDKNANVPIIFATYIVPTHLDPDTPALQLLGKILTDGEASRMYQRLVKKEEAAIAVFGGIDSRKGPSLFRFVAAANVGVDIETCEKLMNEEIEKLKTDGIGEKELEKAKAQFKADFVDGRETVLNKAETLQHYAYFHKSLDDVNTDLDRYMAVTREDIMRVANKYFVSTNRTVVIANPAGRQGS
jgi:zinc protease